MSYEDSVKMLDEMIKRMEDEKAKTKPEEWLLIEEAMIVLLKVVRARLF